MLPDKLQHQQLVEIRIEQGPGDGIELPVMVMRAPGQVDDHDGPNCIEWPGKNRTACISVPPAAPSQAGSVPIVSDRGYRDARCAPQDRRTTSRTGTSTSRIGNSGCSSRSSMVAMATAPIPAQS